MITRAIRSGITSLWPARSPAGNAISTPRWTICGSCPGGVRKKKPFTTWLNTTSGSSPRIRNIGKVLPSNGRVSWKICTVLKSRTSSTAIPKSRWISGRPISWSKTIRTPTHPTPTVMTWMSASRNWWGRGLTLSARRRLPVVLKWSIPNTIRAASRSCSSVL